MIPYWEISPIRLWGGSLTLQPFGILVAVGCVLGWFAVEREVRQRNLDIDVVNGAAVWGLLIGFPAASIFDVALYRPELVHTDPLALFQFWNYMSSYGGFVGGTIGVVGYLSLHRRPIFPYLDCLIVGLVVGWFFGRLGCTIVHDHPGVKTDFFLGVRFPSGTRHDLGFYEWIYTIFMLLIIYSIPRHALKAGMTLGLVCMLYAPVRFGLDFLRTADRLYLGLTPAQYSSLVLFVISIAIIAVAMRRPPQGSPFSAPEGAVTSVQHLPSRRPTRGVKF